MNYELMNYKVVLLINQLYGKICLSKIKSTKTILSVTDMGVSFKNSANLSIFGDAPTTRR